MDSIKQIPRYAKFLKELFPTKCKLKRNEVANLSENVSTMLQRKLPPKCRDPRSFTIPCTIQNTRFEKAILDLEVSIIVMLYSIYASLDIGPFGVNEMPFQEKIYVLHMGDRIHNLSTLLLLCRPFMKTTCIKMDIHSGTLNMDGESIHFNIFEAMRYPDDINSCYFIDSIDYFVE